MPNIIKKDGYYAYVDDFGNVNTEDQQIEELETTGIAFIRTLRDDNKNIIDFYHVNNHAFRYTENDIRRENNIPIRIKY